MMATAKPRVSPKRIASAAVLGSWAALFWFLILTDRISFYLSTRTAWVVPVGAAILTVALIGRSASLTSGRPESFSLSETVGYIVLIVPVIIVLVLPPTSLASYAATRRSSISGASFVTTTGDAATGDLSLTDVAAALRSAQGRKALAQRAGDTVSFTGFVARYPGMSADEFTLTRFVVSCCVADALAVQVRVANAPPGGFENDQWVRVTGKFYPLGEEGVVDATEIEPVARPKHPYLSA
jgi:uncharacterized repeat protein (TIGR03943 family)